MSKETSQNNAGDFGEILSIIEKARENTFRAVNRELISMYWDIGRYISEKVKTNGWGKSVVSDFADFVQNQYVGIKGFSSQNIWRMKQFYETYVENEKLSALLREISWTNNLTVMSRAKSAEAREFYLYPVLRSDLPMKGMQSIYKQTRPDEYQSFLNTIGLLWKSCIIDDLSAVYKGKNMKKVSMLPYPYDRKRFWYDQDDCITDQENRSGKNPIGTRSEQEKKIMVVWQQLLARHRIYSR